MKLRPGTGAMTALLACLTAMGPLSTDMYLPSLPTISLALRADPAQVQLTLSVFLVGFAVGQIIYGPLSDRFGRRPVLLSGLGLFAIASAGCMLASTIELLILARFGQAVSACAAIVIARAIVRDLYRADNQPEQSYSERQLYEAALDRMAREIAAVNRMSETEAVRLIEINLNKGPKRGAKAEADNEEAEQEEAA